MRNTRRGRVYLGNAVSAGGFNPGAVIGNIGNIGLQAFGMYQQGKIAKTTSRTDRAIGTAQAAADADLAASREALAAAQQERTDQQRQNLLNYLVPAGVLLFGLGTIYMISRK